MTSRSTPLNWVGFAYALLAWLFGSELGTSSQWVRADATVSLSDAPFLDAPHDSNNLWISFTIRSLPTTAETYRFKFGGKSEYDMYAHFLAGNFPFATDTNLDCGLITVNAVSGAVPESSMVVVGGNLVAALVLRRCKQFGTTKEQNRTTPRQRIAYAS